MTVRYGKIGSKLLALPNVGKQNNIALAEGFDMLFEIDEHNIDHVMAMLLTSGMVGVDPWRLRQIINFYDIADDEFISFSRRYDITVNKKDNSFILEHPAPSGEGFIRIKSENLFLGLIQVFISMGQRIPL